MFFLAKERREKYCGFINDISCDFTNFIYNLLDTFANFGDGISLVVWGFFDPGITIGGKENDILEGGELVRLDGILAGLGYLLAIT